VLEARHPIGALEILTNQPGHALTPEIKSQARKVLTDQRARNQVLSDPVDSH